MSSLLKTTPFTTYPFPSLSLTKQQIYSADIIPTFVGCGIIITEQVGCRTMSALRTPTRLIQTLFFVPGKALYIFSKFNPLNTETR